MTEESGEEKERSEGELAFQPATTRLHPRFRKNGRAVQLSTTVTSSLPPSTRSAGNVGYWVIIAGGGSSFSVAGSFSNQLLLRKDNDENQGELGITRECNSSSQT